MATRPAPGRPTVGAPLAVGDAAPATPAGAATALRARQAIEALCAASLRALSGERDLHFRGQRLHRGRRALPLYAPHLHPAFGEDDFASFRGAADGVALRLLHSDAALHARHRPRTPVARLVFEMLEQARVESLADPALPGVGHNLQHRFEQWLLAFHRSRLTETQRGLLLYTVAQVARARVRGEAVPDAGDELIETCRGRLAQAIGPHVAALRRERRDQAAYAVHALAIAGWVEQQMVALAGGDGSAPGVDVDDDDDDENDDERAAFALVMDRDTRALDEAVSAVAGSRGFALDEAGEPYRVYTRAYDRELQAAGLARSEQLAEWRARLDGRIAAEAVPIARLVRELKALFAAPRTDGWDGAQEEGLIDGRRLAQLVAVPNERRLFQRPRHEPLVEGVLAFLVDCSGSMREHIEAIAVVVDVMARALEHCGASSEVLGFTTGAWHGGRPQRDWVRAGRPPHPGRLNEVRHLVFKDAETPWRRSRPAVAALLKTDLLREGIDGEAVDWAVARLRQRDERRKILIVFSDGCPMDGATGLANDPHYLDRHLRDVVARHEQQGHVRIVGLGVGLDMSPFYRQTLAVDFGKSSAAAVLRDLIGLLARPPG